MTVPSEDTRERAARAIWEHRRATSELVAVWLPWDEITDDSERNDVLAEAEAVLAVVSPSPVDTDDLFGVNVDASLDGALRGILDQFTHEDYCPTQTGQGPGVCTCGWGIAQDVIRALVQQLRVLDRKAGAVAMRPLSDWSAEQLDRWAAQAEADMTGAAPPVGVDGKNRFVGVDEGGTRVVEVVPAHALREGDEAQATYTVFARIRKVEKYAGTPDRQVFFDGIGSGFKMLDNEPALRVVAAVPSSAAALLKAAQALASAATPEPFRLGPSACAKSAWEARPTEGPSSATDLQVEREDRIAAEDRFLHAQTYLRSIASAQPLSTQAEWMIKMAKTALEWPPSTAPTEGPGRRDGLSPEQVEKLKALGWCGCNTACALLPVEQARTGRKCRYVAGKVKPISKLSKAASDLVDATVPTEGPDDA